MENDAGTPTPAPPSTPSPGSRTPKSEQTRARILDAALRLFAERGYDKTTMRAIAQEAGVSVGNAYYYFAGKEHLIQGYYDQITHDHIAAAHAAMTGTRDFGQRLRLAWLTWIDTAEPYHGFAVQFFRNAADPDSPLSPFSAESYPARARVTDLFRDVITGSTLTVDDELADLLPELLWLHLMGIVMYWVYDKTPGAERSRRLVERTAPLVARAITLSRYRVFRPLVRDAERVVREFIVPTAAQTGQPGPSAAAADR